MPAPSLFADTVLLDLDLAAEPVAAAAAVSAASPPAPRDAACLLDLLHDGYYMVFLLRNGHRPTDAEAFRDGVRGFLAAFEHGGRRLGRSAGDIHDAKFAFCALVDEVVLRSDFAIRDAWQRRPLQLELFGEQLAGERFFALLDSLRAAGPARLEVLEVLHRALLLGFEGRYLLEGPEKLGYLTSRVGEEIAAHRGRGAAFAPHWAAPDRVAHALRGQLPAWAVAAAFVLFGALGFAGLRTVLDRQTAADLAAYADVVTLAPQAAHFTITLP